VAPGKDTFPEEAQAAELADRLKGFAALLRQGGAPTAREAALGLLAPAFRGGPLLPEDEVTVRGDRTLEVVRARGLPGEPTRDRRAFVEEFTALLADFASLETAEFLITAIDVTGEPPTVARTEVRYDLSGRARQGWRAQRLGRWRMQWTRGGDGWRVTEWTALDHLRSRSSDPVFTEVTGTALGVSPAFRHQLAVGLDAWLTVLDSAFLPGGMGHHGVSAGDYDGDGLDDLYVSQPAGLPNRLFRNRGDGSFEDVTEAAGVGVLDGTSQSLFADLNNDGDQDLILITTSQPLLFVNDGKGRFTRDADAFRFRERLRGSLTSGALADYDRDGFLDLYLCTYSYLIGASEDKAGPPTPYHDAQNGPPNALLRNDGRGRFVEVTAEAGLDRGNDRFSFAPAWADYDEDGWPDLAVANDFGRKNLYRNLGGRGGGASFEDVAGAAGVEDYGAGMSATWLDYDNDGRLDLYTGNMWTASGRRVTASRGFMPQAPPEIRELYRRHARGNSLFRNRGDGTFDDVTLGSRTEMGRWAWSSDAVDFDSDGWEDLYVVNGMFTREGEEVDVDGFFWRQVTAQSPLTRVTGTAYDDAWRATNRLLVTLGSQASHERNVLLRNDGRGGFDEVSGSAGLDLDQDGRSFAVLDSDLDGDPDLALMAPRSAPQLRVFRNDFRARTAALAVRLTGTRSNRDAVGARVSVETDRLKRTKLVQAGSGFISQHAKELLFGLGESQRVLKVTIAWPSGLVQTLSSVPLNHRVWIEEGGEPARVEPFRRLTAGPPTRAAVAELPVAESWLYQPYPAPDFTLPDLAGGRHTLSASRGRPTVVLFWAAGSPASRAALEELARGRHALVGAASVLTVAVDGVAEEAKVRAAARGIDLPVLLATEEAAGTYSILHRYLFDRREDLRLPTALLVDARGEIAKVYRHPIAAARIAGDLGRIDASAADRLARAVPFPGEFAAPPGQRNYFQYGLELAEQGFDAPALVAFERVVDVDPSPITFYNLGTLYLKGGQPSRARLAFERALALQPSYAEASNSLGALVAQNGDLAGAVQRFRAALEARPDFPDALNNLGYALFQSGQAEEAHGLYQKALMLKPDFPEAHNNLGIFFGRRGDLALAERHFRRAVDSRPGYGEAGNNLALVLAARGEEGAAVGILERLIQESPGFEATYLTLSRLHLRAGRRQQGIQVLERLLQQNPRHSQGLQLLKQLRDEG
jgi:Tfp pilus assembly protein PilF/peroxiredoxin